MKLIKRYYIIERKYSGNVLAYEEYDTETNTSKEVRAMVAFGKKHDKHLDYLCKVNNGEEE